MMGLWSEFKTIRHRRAALRAHFDIRRSFARLEESCVPSYCHNNWLAAAAAWLRLVRGAGLWRRFAANGPVLDFGAGSGELAHFIEAESYCFVEGDDFLSQAVLSFVPTAGKRVLEKLEDGFFAAIFALDSLEHNEDVAALVDQILPALRDDGVFIVSGPTENALYRAGRRIAGFQGDYHMTNIIEIERILGQRMECVKRTRVPFGVPLFHVSAWRLIEK